MSNLCREKPKPNFDLVRPVIPVLADLLTTHSDNDVLTDACWALS